MLGWREIDFALISEASKIRPDFSKMEQLVRDGADVNAMFGDDDENALSAVILGMENDDMDENSPAKDSLPIVVEFFIKHGFDPERNEGRAGAKCLANLAFSRCLASKIPAMKLLLDAGCRDVPEDRDAHNPEDAKPSIAIATEESYLRHQGDLESAKIYDTLHEMLMANEEKLKGKALYEAAKSGTIFEEDGKVGVKDADGNVVVPACYGQIFWEGDVLVLMNDCKEGCMLKRLYPDGGRSCLSGTKCMKQD